jgi:excisionase family DNA binding protein
MCGYAYTLPHMRYTRNKCPYMLLLLALIALAQVRFHGHLMVAFPVGLELLTIRDLMRVTHESESVWRKRLGRREIQFVRLGANVRVRREDLDTWLAARTIPSRKRGADDIVNLHTNSNPEQPVSDPESRS